ncbi:hypothetical protein GCM10027034_19870 [Ramlibacter solisilvae]|uniref:Uncharacterized protein n=1 Tax=Ramlibacter tataouinensis TaxID=94132 RepID=A0A127JV91_9BURK|nr:hypothetical protein [Ramlibacter tataouinensis]AMO23927.1 hypothetical protein UC35_14975 [Ramlibacter tataouinensis]
MASSKKRSTDDPPRVIDPNAPHFQPLAELTVGMTPQQRAKYKIEFVRKLGAAPSAVISEAMRLNAQPPTSESTSDEAMAIFRKMAKLPTPMAADPDLDQDRDQPPDEGVE